MLLHDHCIHHCLFGIFELKWFSVIALRIAGGWSCRYLLRFDFASWPLGNLRICIALSLGCNNFRTTSALRFWGALFRDNFGFFVFRFSFALDLWLELACQSSWLRYSGWGFRLSFRFGLWLYLWFRILVYLLSQSCGSNFSLSPSVVWGLAFARTQGLISSYAFSLGIFITLRLVLTLISSCFDFNILRLSLLTETRFTVTWFDIWFESFAFRLCPLFKIRLACTWFGCRF